MPTAIKAQEIDNLRESFGSAKVTILTSVTGLTVEEVTKLRKDLRATGARAKVVKNTLARIASEGTDVEKVKENFVGPIMVTMGFDEDIAAPAKTLLDFAKGTKDRMKVVAGVLEGSAVDAAGVRALADLPPKPVVQAMLLGLFQAPARNFLSLMVNVPRSVMNVMTNYAKKKEEGGA
jgi:large subunit ribosomal protein L10